MAIRIKNWSKFQHFKDRRPPWVKLYRDLLDDREWHRLDGDSAKMLVELWLLASENEGELPHVEDIAFRLRSSDAKVSRCIERLSHWFEIECHQADIAPSQEKTATEVSVYQETETETETEKRERQSSAPRPQAIACSPSPEKSPKPAKPAAVDASLLIEAGFSPEVAAEFIAHKTSQKAPLTPRAWSDHVAEARKAGWTPQQAAEKVMAKGWKGFEAKYVQNEARPNAPAQAAAPIVSPAIEKTRELLASHELPPEQIEANRQRAAELRAQLNLRAVA